MEGQNPEFKVLEGQNPEFKILEGQNLEFKSLEGQNPEFKILEGQNPEFKILEGHYSKNVSSDIQYWIVLARLRVKCSVKTTDCRPGGK